MGKRLLRGAISALIKVVMFVSMVIFRCCIWLGIIRQVAALGAKLGNSPRSKRRIFRKYTPGEHDVMVCTFSKSGTNWTLQIVTQIAAYGEAEFDHIHDIVPWAEAQMLPYIVRLDEPTYKLAATGLRAVKTHMEAEYVPYNEKAKYITVIRNPRDVIVSAWHFTRNLMPIVKGLMLDDFIDMHLAGHTIFGVWSQHTAGYWKWRDRSNVLVLFYEDMRRDLEGTVRKIAGFMGVDLAPGHYASVVEKSSFQYMQNIDHKFAPDIPGLTRNSGKPIMMRAGKSDTGNDELTPEQVARIDQVIIRQLREIGSDFPYAERYMNKR